MTLPVLIDCLRQQCICNAYHAFIKLFISAFKRIFSIVGIYFLTRFLKLPIMNNVNIVQWCFDLNFNNAGFRSWRITFCFTQCCTRSLHRECSGWTSPPSLMPACSTGPTRYKSLSSHLFV